MVLYERKEKYKKPTSAKEVLVIAKARESASVGFYEEMSGHKFAAEIKDLLLYLKNQELGHVKIIENKLAKLEEDSTPQEPL